MLHSLEFQYFLQHTSTVCALLLYYFSAKTSPITDVVEKMKKNKMPDILPSCDQEMKMALNRLYHLCTFSSRFCQSLVLQVWRCRAHLMLVAALGSRRGRYLCEDRLYPGEISKQ